MQEEQRREKKIKTAAQKVSQLKSCRTKIAKKNTHTH
jgi:hypothetical protein